MARAEREVQKILQAFKGNKLILSREQKLPKPNPAINSDLLCVRLDELEIKIYV